MKLETHLVAPKPRAAQSCPADGVCEAPRFRITVKNGIGEGRIPPELAPPDRAAVERDGWFQKVMPAVRTVHISGSQGAAIKIAELIEHEHLFVCMRKNGLVRSFPNFHQGAYDRLAK